MADYYSILTKTISRLDNNIPERRQMVYGKARKAIEAQLRQLEPAPGADAIRSQLNLLEEAIVFIESEYDDGSPSVPAPKPVINIPVPPPATPVVDARAPSEAEVSSTSLPVDVGVPVSASSELPGPDTQISQPDNQSGQAGVPPELVELAGTSRQSGIGSALITLIILGLIGMGAYAIWLNRDTIITTASSFLEGDSSGTSTQSGANTVETAPQEESVPDVPEPSTDDKETVRIADAGNEETTEPAEPEPQQAAETETPVVIEQPEPQPETQEPSDAVEPADGEENAGAAGDTNDPVTPSNAPLGEIAYLYEEGSAGSGASRSNARINWSLVNVKPTEVLPAEPVILGSMEVPEKGIAVEINIKRNVDESLSASHIIEMTFEVPEGFSGGSIENIARFVMKPSEEARGEPLVAVPVKVSDGFFLIALDNLEQAVQVNRQLLLNSGWIDIPISYATGKRALLTLEKGGSGDQVFKQAFADWQNR